MNHKTQGYSILHRLSLLLFSVGWFWMLLGFWGVFRGELEASSRPLTYSLVAFMGMLVAVVGSFHKYHDYLELGRWDRLKRAVAFSNMQGLMVAFLMFMTYFLVKDIAISRAFLAFFILSHWILMIVMNYWLPDFLKWAFREDDRYRQTLLIGTGDTLAEIREWVVGNVGGGFNITGIYTPGGGGGRKELGLEELESIDNLEKYLARHKVFRVVIVPGLRSDYWMQGIIDICQSQGCRIFIHNPYASHFNVPLVPVVESGQPFFSLQDEPLESPFNQTVKRLFDLAVSLPVVLLVLPVLTFVVWLFQRIQSPGPVFFRQERGGKGGEPFTILKFRSMKHRNPTEADEVQATRDDERTYAFGRFIRKFSIDEFPQFVNVLLGDMSLVGPRPYMVEHDKLLGKDFRAYRVRQFVKPGVTGPAQCAGLRGEVVSPDLLQARNEMDFHYVGNWSLMLDVEIVLRTALQVVAPPKSAY
mgnify:CR=1 FL=1